jgi:hypothetical protein
MAQRLVAERHGAAPHHRVVGAVGVVRQRPGVVELGAADPQIDVEVALALVGVVDERAALGLERHHALIGDLVRQVVRRLGALLELAHPALVLRRHPAEDGRRDLGLVARARLDAGQLDLARDGRQLGRRVAGRGDG